MKLDNIMKTINLVNYEATEVIIPVKDLVTLRREILKLRKDREDLLGNLKRESLAHDKTRGEALKILANSEPVIQRFETYA